ncbi:glucosamine-phosphate N-acetyltransferase [Nematocida sp. AWRm77]|nr:glucosamine-phosphate N-acetyltransferase [Nematocida sp. AWRm77]
MEKFRIRPLERKDLTPEYFQVLSDLTKAPLPSTEDLDARWAFFSQRKETYIILVVECEEQVVGCGTLLVEHKLIRNLGKVGHIEDIVISSKHQGEGLGKLLITALVEHSKKSGCYKTILACSEENKPFYAKCGFTAKEIEMAMYHNND